VKRLEDLIGAPEDLSPEERERLLRVHQLLLGVPPPPDLPARLESPTVVPLRRRRRYVPALIAAALLVATFAFGFLAGRAGDPDVVRTVEMAGVGDAQGASASIELFELDDAGNWPMDLHVSGLPRTGHGGWYELWLTKDGRPIASCGRFTVDEDGATVRLTVPYPLSDYNGWIVTRRGSDAALLTT
jgi:Anti-sigma-K factor rskA